MTDLSLLMNNVHPLSLSLDKLLSNQRSFLFFRIRNFAAIVMFFLRYGAGYQPLILFFSRLSALSCPFILERRTQARSPRSD